MAYILTPRFAQVYQAAECNPFGACASTLRPAYGYRTAQRPQSQPRPSLFTSFFSQIEDLVSEIDRESLRQTQIEAQREAQQEAQRAAHIQAQRQAYEAYIEAQRAAYRERQAQIEAHVVARREANRQQELRKRDLRAQFAVSQNQQGWQVDAEIPGFQQENINIEVTGENTLKIAGNTGWGAKPQTEAQPEVEVTPALDQIIEESSDEKMEGITLEPSIETATATTDTEINRPTTPDSDTSSHKSYQPTVEDDFEDLGVEASTLFSKPSTTAIISEPKGKEKALERAVTAEDPEVSVPAETAFVHQPQSEAEQHPHVSFERTYNFPERIGADGVRASFKDGVLSITVPRAQAQQIRRVAIS